MTIMENPFFSIVIPTKDRPSMLTRAVRSISRQTFLSYEVIVVNDGSSVSYTSEISNFVLPNLSYITLDESMGASAARNIGIRHSRGNWVIFLDDDDEFAPDYFSRLFDKIQSVNNLMLGFLWSNVQFRHYDIQNRKAIDVLFDFTDDAINTEKTVLAAACIGASYGLAVRRSVFFDAGFFDQTFSQGEDTEFILRVLSFNYYPEVVLSVGVIKHNHVGERLSSSWRPYSKTMVYERIEAIHDLFLRKNPKIKSNMLNHCGVVHFHNASFSLGLRALLKALVCNPFDQDNLNKIAKGIAFALKQLLLRVASKN